MLKRLIAAGLVMAALTPPAFAETLRWGGQRDIYSLDPYSYGDSYTLAFLNHVYEGLVRFDSDLAVEPALATRWEAISDTVWRFTLRDDVRFHDGATFDADDVIASLERVSHETSPLRGNLPAFKSASKVDAHTVDIELTGPYPLLLNDLTNIFIFDAGWLEANDSLLPTDVGAQKEGFATYNTNGTGPFRVEERQPDAKTVLSRNDAWWDEAVHNIDRIEFIPISSSATRVAALLSGEVDFTEAVPAQDIGRLQASPNLTVLESTDLRTIMFGFNRRETLADGRPNAFNDLRVRQAIAHALDPELIQKRVMRGQSRSAATIVAPDIPGYTAELDAPYGYDLEKARTLLKEAGQEGFPFTLVCTNDAYLNEEELCQATIAMLSRAGFQPSLDIAPVAAQAPKRTGGRADIYLIGWANEPMLDSYSILLQMVKTKSDVGGIFNWGGWSYPDIDALIESASTEMDRNKRLGLQTQALERVKEEIVLLPLHQQPMTWVHSDRVASVLQKADNKPRHWLTKLN